MAISVMIMIIDITTGIVSLLYVEVETASASSMIILQTGSVTFIVSTPVSILNNSIIACSSFYAKQEYARMKAGNARQHKTLPGKRPRQEIYGAVFAHLTGRLPLI
jgi:hypothetical protein